MSAQHTPGPWRFASIIGRCGIWSPGGLVAATPEWIGRESEMLANARLIAAAPELLAVCQEIANWPDCCSINALARDAAAAISKATAPSAELPAADVETITGGGK